MGREKQLSLFQGKSSVTTVKSKDIYDIVKMRLIQNQGVWIDRGGLQEMVLCDVFSGDGENIVDGRLVLGSPIRIIEAVESSNLMYRLPKVTIVFSDIRRTAVEMLRKRVETASLPPNVNVHIMQGDAFDIIPKLNQYLTTRRTEIGRRHGVHALTVVDPNGPKGLPVKELQELSNSNGSICDLLINLNISASKRVWGLGEGKVRGWWAEEFKSLDDLVGALGENYHSNWVRLNRPGLFGWTILGFWGYSPPKHWNYNGVNGGFLPYLEARESWES